jgi:hypothetical protein
MIHRDLARFVDGAQYEAFNTHTELAPIVQPGACLGWGLRARNQPDLRWNSREGEDDVIAVTEERFDGAPVRTLKVQPGICGGCTLWHRSADGGGTVGQSLPHRPHSRLV